MVEVLAALSLFLVMCATTIVVGKPLLARERERQFLSALERQWDELRARSQLNGTIGAMLIGDSVVSFSDSDAQSKKRISEQRLAIPETLVLVASATDYKPEWKTNKRLYQFQSPNQVTSGQFTFKRGNGKYVKFSILFQWGVMVRTDQ